MNRSVAIVTSFNHKLNEYMELFPAQQKNFAIYRVFQLHLSANTKTKDGYHSLEQNLWTDCTTSLHK